MGACPKESKQPEAGVAEILVLCLLFFGATQVCLDDLDLLGQVVEFFLELFAVEFGLVVQSLGALAQNLDLIELLTGTGFLPLEAARFLSKLGTPSWYSP